MSTLLQKTQKLVSLWRSFQPFPWYCEADENSSITDKSTFDLGMDHLLNKMPRAQALDSIRAFSGLRCVWIRSRTPRSLCDTYIFRIGAQWSYQGLPETASRSRNFDQRRTYSIVFRCRKGEEWSWTEVVYILLRFTFKAFRSSPRCRMSEIETK